MNKANVIALCGLLGILALAVWAAAVPERWRVIGAYQSSVAGRTHSQVHNLRLAVKPLDGAVIPPGAVFSFNRTVGSWTPDRGYVKAPVSYDGELIPAWGGGVCQASSTLYNAALLAGLEVVERHRHQFPARYVPPGQDAAVAQYNIDLRFRNPYSFPVKIEAEIVGDQIICRILAQQRLDRQISVEREVRQVTQPSEVIRTGRAGETGRWHTINHGAPGMQVAVYRRVTVGDRSTRALVSEDTYPPMNVLVVGR